MEVMIGIRHFPGDHESIPCGNPNFSYYAIYILDFFKLWTVIFWWKSITVSFKRKIFLWKKNPTLVDLFRFFGLLYPLNPFKSIKRKKGIWDDKCKYQPSQIRVILNHLESPTEYDKIKTTSIRNIYLIFTLHVDFKIQRINVYFRVKFIIENLFITYIRLKILLECGIFSLKKVINEFTVQNQILSE